MKDIRVGTQVLTLVKIEIKLILKELYFGDRMSGVF
jgi:hypothetical protein